MERHQAGQEETLVEVRVETDSWPRGSPVDRRRGCFKCVVALATVMGLVIVGLGVGFILHFFMFTPSCNQNAPLMNGAEKVNIMSKLTSSDKLGSYDIFTVNKAATYLIYGWVKFSDDSPKEVILKQTLDGSFRTLLSRTESNREIFFNLTAKMVNLIRISIHFNSTHTDSLFHMYEL